MEQISQMIPGFIAGLVTAAIIIVLIMRRQIKELASAFKEKESDLTQAKIRLEAAMARLDEKETQIRKAEKMCEEKDESVNSMQKELSDALGRNQRLEAELALVTESRNNERKTMQDSFKTQMELLSEHMENLSGNALKTASAQLKEDNAENMQKIIAPIRTQYDELQKSINSANEMNARNASSLGQQLLEFGRKADRMDDTAKKLTHALRGSSRQMGSWGEMVLKQLLDSQGLQEGRDYEMQSTITDGNGNTVKNQDDKAMRPDAVLHYPGNQDVFIDSKVSIKDYYDYANETDDTRKADALKKHAASLRKHYMELARKDYSSYMAKGHTTIDFVIMFVPNDTALQEAMTYDPALWTDAFEKKVFITGTQNLFAILKMIEIAWQHFDQTENMKRIISSATEIVQRIGLLSKRINKFEEDYNSIAKDVKDIRTSMDGNKGILRKAIELKELGIREDKSYPITTREICGD